MDQENPVISTTLPCAVLRAQCLAILSVATQFVVGATVALPVSSRQNRLLETPNRLLSGGTAIVAPARQDKTPSSSQKHSPHVTVTHVLDNVVSAHGAPSSVPLQRTAGGRRWR